MPLVPTDLGSHLFDNGAGFTPQGSGPFATGPVDVPARSIVGVKIHCGSDDISNINNYVVTSPNLTWNKIQQHSLDYEPNNGTILQDWYALNDTDTPLDDEVITVTHTGSSGYQFGVLVRAWTGHDPADPIGGIATGDSTGTSQSLTISEAPANGDDVWASIYVIAANGNGSDASATPGSSFVEDYEVNATNSFAKWESARRTASNSTAVSWTTATSAGATFQDRIYSAFTVRELLLTGSANITEAGDTLDSDAVIFEGIIGLANITEAGDTVTGTAELDIAGTANITEEGDTLDSDGALAIAGSADITEDDDTLTSTAEANSSEFNDPNVGGADNRRNRLRRSRLGRETKGRIGPGNATVNQHADALDRIGRRAARMPSADIGPGATNVIGRFDGLDHSPQSRHVKTRGRKDR